MPNFGAFKSKNSSSPEYDRLLDILAQNPLLQGRLIEDVELDSTAVLVPHKLNRAYRGWIITDIDADVNVYNADTPLFESYIALVASGPCVVSLWVF